MQFRHADAQRSFLRTALIRRPVLAFCAVLLVRARGEAQAPTAAQSGASRTTQHLITVDAGADLVLGHGPHVLRGMELYKGHLIAYSMGSFCTYGMFGLHGETALTAVFQLTVDREGHFVSGQIYPGRQNKPGGPIPDPTGEAIQVLRQLSIADFGPNAPKIADDGSFHP